MSNSQNILFSIIVPTYNRAGMINRAIESVLAQTYSNWELIIINDGSTDNTAGVIHAFKDDRIKYFYQENRGKSAARNFGIEMSKGEYISFLDDDDYYLPEFLEKFYIKIKKENYSDGLYMCGVAEEGNNGIINRKINTKFIDNSPLFIWRFGAGYFSYITYREIFKTEKFISYFPLGQDFHLLIRVALKLPLHYIPDILCVIRNHSERSVIKEYKENFTTDGVNRLDYLQDLLDNYFENLNKYIPANKIYDKYNKIAYFYASTALRKNKIKYAIKLLRLMKWGGTFYKVFYYKSSIFIRLGYYKLLFLLKGKYRIT